MDLSFLLLIWWLVTGSAVSQVYYCIYEMKSHKLAFTNYLGFWQNKSVLCIQSIFHSLTLYRITRFSLTQREQVWGQIREKCLSFIKVPSIHFGFIGAVIMWNICRKLIKLFFSVGLRESHLDKCKIHLARDHNRYLSLYTEMIATLFTQNYIDFNAFPLHF